MQLRPPAPGKTIGIVRLGCRSLRRRQLRCRSHFLFTIRSLACFQERVRASESEGRDRNRSTGYGSLWRSQDRNDTAGFSQGGCVDSDSHCFSAPKQRPNATATKAAKAYLQPGAFSARHIMSRLSAQRYTKENMAPPITRNAQAYTHEEYGRTDPCAAQKTPG